MITKEELEAALLSQDMRAQLREEGLVKRCVKETISMLGVDSEDPKDVREFQETISFSKGVMRTSRKVAVAIITLCATSLVSLAFIFFKPR